MSFSKHIKYLFTFLAISSIAVSCSKDDPDPWWNNKDNPDKPAPTPDPDPEPEVPAEKPRFMWIDAPANFPRFADSQENIAKDLKKAYDSGITDVVVDIRPYTGDILFASSTGDPMVRIDVWDNGYHFYNRTATWDYLQTFIDKGHEISVCMPALTLLWAAASITTDLAKTVWCIATAARKTGLPYSILTALS